MTESCRLVTTEQYKEYQLLKKKLDIAVKALKKYEDPRNWVIGNFMCAYDGEALDDYHCAEQALQEIEEVK